MNAIIPRIGHVNRASRIYGYTKGVVELPIPDATRTDSYFNTRFIRVELRNLIMVCVSNPNETIWIYRYTSGKRKTRLLRDLEQKLLSLG